MVVALALLSCRPDGGAATDALIPPNDGMGSASLTLEAPGAAAFLDPGSHPVSGVAHQVDDITINGQAAPLSGPAFVADVDLPVGLTTLKAEGTDGGGMLHRDSFSVVAGDFATASGSVPDAVQLHLAASTFDALTAGAADGIDPAALSDQLSALNPLVDTPEAVVNLGELTFGPPDLALVLEQDAILIDIFVPEFVLGIEATIVDALPFGIDLNLDPDLTGDMSLSTRLGLAPDGQGGLTATIAPLEVDLIDFDLDTGILELIDWLFLDDEDLANTLEQQLAGLGSALQPIIDEALDLDLATETEIMGSIVGIVPSFDRVDITPQGLGFGLGIAIDADATDPGVPGHLTFPPPAPYGPGDVSIQISDAFMNRALFELWSAGALDMELPLGTEDIAILFLFGGQDSGNLAMTAAMPPLWLEGPSGGARLQLGEIALTVDTPGGDYGDRIELIMALDAAAEVSISADAASVVLSDADIHMRTAGDSKGHEALEAYVPTLESSFAIGIGMINELLTFPLTDLVGPDTTLPELSFERDPSGVGTVLDLSVDDLTSLGGAGTDPDPADTGTTDTGTTDTGTPGGLIVAIGADAVVYEDDATVTTDGEVGWICSRQEVDVSGNGGTWYVDDRGELTLTGTGHTVYAVDDADVRLDVAGNTVTADPGAGIDDRDGTNTIILIDPVEFDLSSAPVPGC